MRSNVSRSSNIGLVVAALLGGAAYLFADDTASAQSSGAPVSGGSSGNNGFGINNPGNIRYNSANNWVGQTGQQNGFCVFDTLAHGVRAMGILLTKYYEGGLTTVTQIISKWAPSSENATGAYITDVAQRVGTAPDEPLSWPNDEVAMIQAIAYHENGFNPMQDSDVEGYIS
jgi:hypothetical protein